jgi:hypothetical protein
MSDPIPGGLSGDQALTYVTGAVARNAAILEGKIERIPKESQDPEIDGALRDFWAAEERARRERNNFVHGAPPEHLEGDPGLQIESARGAAQVLRRLSAQVDALELLIAGAVGGERERLLRIGGGRFRVDPDGSIHQVPDYD